MEYSSWRFNVHYPTSSSRDEPFLVDATARAARRSSPSTSNTIPTAQPPPSPYSIDELTLDRMLYSHIRRIKPDAHGHIHTGDAEVDQWFTRAESHLYPPVYISNLEPPSDPRVFSLLALTLFRDYKHPARYEFWNPEIQQATARKIIKTLDGQEYTITPRCHRAISKLIEDARFHRPATRKSSTRKSTPTPKEKLPPRKTRAATKPKSKPPVVTLTPTPEASIVEQPKRKRGRPPAERDENGKPIKRAKVTHPVVAAPVESTRVSKRVRDAKEVREASMSGSGSGSGSAAPSLSPSPTPVPSGKRKRGASTLSITAPIITAPHTHNRAPSSTVTNTSSSSTMTSTSMSMESTSTRLTSVAGDEDDREYDITPTPSDTIEPTRRRSVRMKKEEEQDEEDRSSAKKRKVTVPTRRTKKSITAKPSTTKRTM